MENYNITEMKGFYETFGLYDIKEEINHNLVIAKVIKTISESPEFLDCEGYTTSELRASFYTEMLKYITDKMLLTSFIGFLRCCGWLENYDKVFEHLSNSVFVNRNYTEIERLRILAIVSSGMMEHEIIMAKGSKIIGKNDIDFKFKYYIHDRTVTLYVDEVYHKYNALLTSKLTTELDKMQSEIKRKNGFNILIRFMNDLNLSNRKTIYQPEIDYLKELRDLPVINKKRMKKVKTFDEHFYNIKNRELFFEELKTTFQTEIGITFRILLDELKKVEILKIGNSEFLNFHLSAQSFFSHDIGTRAGIIKYKPEDLNNFKKEIDIISSKLKPLIDKYKTN